LCWEQAADGWTGGAAIATNRQGCLLLLEKPTSFCRIERIVIGIRGSAIG